MLLSTIDDAVRAWGRFEVGKLSKTQSRTSKRASIVVLLECRLRETRRRRAQPSSQRTRLERMSSCCRCAPAAQLCFGPHTSDPRGTTAHACCGELQLHAAATRGASCVAGGAAVYPGLRQGCQLNTSAFRILSLHKDTPPGRCRPCLLHPPLDISLHPDCLHI